METMLQAKFSERTKSYHIYFNCVGDKLCGQPCSKFSREPQVEQKFHWCGHCNGCERIIQCGMH